MNSTNRREIFVRLREANPYPAIELEYTTPFELLIAVLLSAKTTDVAVNKATRKLYKIANTPIKIYTLGILELMKCIKTVGLYRTKAKNIIETCRILLNSYDNNVPQTREALESLPGVGRKTANIVLNIAFGQTTIAVDTHIYRVSNRTGLASGKNVNEVERKLTRFIPLEFQKNAHQWLILHGRYICTARKFKCWNCIISDLCEFPKKVLFSL